MLYPKNHPNHTFDYWLVTPNQQTSYIETDTFTSGILQNSGWAITKNSVNVAMLITINRVISAVITLSITLGFDQIFSLKRSKTLVLKTSYIFYGIKLDDQEQKRI